MAGFGPGAYMDEETGEPDWDTYYDAKRTADMDEAIMERHERRENHPNRQVGRERFGGQ